MKKLLSALLVLCAACLYAGQQTAAGDTERRGAAAGNAQAAPADARSQVPSGAALFARAAPGARPAQKLVQVVIKVRDSASGGCEIVGPVPDTLELNASEEPQVDWVVENTCGSAEGVEVGGFRDKVKGHTRPFGPDDKDNVFAFGFKTAEEKRHQNKSLRSKAVKGGGHAPKGTKVTYKYDVTVLLQGGAKHIKDPQVIISFL